MMTSAKQPDEFDAIRIVVDTLKPFPKDEQQRLLRWAQEKLGLPGAAPHEAYGNQSDRHLRDQAATQTPSHTSAHAAGTATDIKSFMDAKSPKSDNQFAAAVAYYYKFEAPLDQRKDTIKKDDLIDACRKVHRNRPKTPAQVLVNALHQGLLDKAERGQYKINSVGENLVAMVLPSQDSGAPKRSGRKPPPKPAKKAKRSGR